MTLGCLHWLQGALAPLAASAALFGAYLLVKFLPDLKLQTLFNAYFWLVGALAVAGGIALPLRRTVRAAPCKGFRILAGGRAGGRRRHRAAAAPHGARCALQRAQGAACSPSLAALHCCCGAWRAP